VVLGVIRVIRVDNNLPDFGNKKSTDFSVLVYILKKVVF